MALHSHPVNIVLSVFVIIASAIPLMILNFSQLFTGQKLVLISYQLVTG